MMVTHPSTNWAQNIVIIHVTNNDTTMPNHNKVPVYFDAWNKLEQHEWKAKVWHTDVCCTECHNGVQFRRASCRLKMRP